MDTKTFFEKFELFADTPYAVTKMRELILQLAAHGKLVDQSVDDEPATVLVGRIVKHFDVLRTSKELRSMPIVALEPENLPPIPANWEWVRLGNVVDYGSSDKTESASIPNDAWLLDLEDIEKDTSRVLRRKAFRTSPSKSTKTAFKVNDVLYGKLRPYLNKVIVADAPGYCTTEIIPIRTFGFIEPAYLCYALKRSEFIAYAISKSYGMNLPRLGTEDARHAMFPLPPLAEQKRIVAKVDELMALCDSLEEQQKEREQRHAAVARASLARFADASTPANLDFLFHKSYDITPADLRKSILTLAVQGKLVPQHPNDKPAAVTFSGISESVAKPAKALPQGWISAKYRELTSLVTSGSRSWKEYYAKSGAVFVRTQNIKTDRLVQDDVAYVKLPDSVTSMRTQIEQNDIMITITGANVTKAARVTGPLPEAYVSQHIALTRPRWGELSEWLHVCFISHGSARATLEKLAYGDKPGLNLNNIRDLVLPIPPLAEQRRIVAKVDHLMAMVDQLEAKLTRSRVLATEVLDALVAELTSGNPDLEISINGATQRSRMISSDGRGRPVMGRVRTLRSKD